MKKIAILYLISGKSKAEDTEDEEECRVGLFSYVEGSYLLVKGKRTIHKVWILQLLVESYEEKQPDDTVALRRYSGSGAIKGISHTGKNC